MAEAVCLCVLAALFWRIHRADVRERAVFAFDVALLCAARLAFLAAACAGAFPAGSFAAQEWGLAGAATSACAGAAVAALMLLLGRAVSRATGREALGVGDVWLYAACCLFLDLEGALLFVGLSALAGAAQGVVACVRGRRDFPFAPALVWSCWATLVLRMAGFGL